MKTIFTLIAALSAIVSNLDGTILEMTNFADLQDFADESTLVVIDLDDTIYAPAQTLGSFDWFHYRLQQNLELDLIYNKALQKTQNEMETVRKISDYVLLQPETQEVLNRLQKENATVIGLTSFRYSFAPILLDQLDSLDLNFSTTLYNLYELSFANFDENILMTNGVLFTGWKQKLNGLKTLINTIEILPSHLVYVSKSKKDLIAVQKAARRANMGFIGLYYNPIDCDCDFAEFRPEIADLEWMLSTLEHIVSDEEAEEYLNWISPK